MWILILLHAIFASTYSFGKLGLDYAQPLAILIAFALFNVCRSLIYHTIWMAFFT